MAFDITGSKLVFGYDNRMTPTLVSGIALTNATADAGYPAANLAYEDPWSMLKVSTTNASDRVIDITFGTSQTITCFGIANHDLHTGGYNTVGLAVWNGSTFVSVGTQDIQTGVIGNPNFLLRFASVGSSTIWRILLGKTSGTRPAFRIGHVFLGTSYQAAENPVDGGMFITREMTVDVVESTSGAIYMRPGLNKLTESAELTFPRIPASMMQILGETIAAGNAGRIVALIPPEQVSYAMPFGTQHLFGYITRCVPSPRGGADSTQHKYDVTIQMQGAV